MGLFPKFLEASFWKPVMNLFKLSPLSLSISLPSEDVYFHEYRPNIIFGELIVKSQKSACVSNFYIELVCDLTNAFYESKNTRPSKRYACKRLMRSTKQIKLQSISSGKTVIPFEFLETISHESINTRNVLCLYWLKAYISTDKGRIEAEVPLYLFKKICPEMIIYTGPTLDYQVIIPRYVFFGAEAEFRLFLHCPWKIQNIEVFLVQECRFDWIDRETDRVREVATVDIVKLLDTTNTTFTAIFENYYMSETGSIFIHPYYISESFGCYHRIRLNISTENGSYEIIEPLTLMTTKSQNGIIPPPDYDSSSEDRSIDISSIDLPPHYDCIEKQK